MAVRGKRPEAGKYRAQRQSLENCDTGAAVSVVSQILLNIFENYKKLCSTMCGKVITSSLAQRNSSQAEWTVFQQVN